MEEPTRAKERSDSEDARCVKSTTDKDDPIRAKPKSENVLPTRAQERKDNDDPN
jgi:hypothetical protein